MTYRTAKALIILITTVVAIIIVTEYNNY